MSDYKLRTVSVNTTPDGKLYGWISFDDCRAGIRYWAWFQDNQPHRIEWAFVDESCEVVVRYFLAAPTIGNPQNVSVYANATLRWREIQVMFNAVPT